LVPTGAIGSRVGRLDHRFTTIGVQKSAPTMGI
jgi:hypothetical protein